jgi:Protein of unknown function (DUF2439)
MEEALRFTCVYSNDAAQKKRKRWADGVCEYSAGVLRVHSETTERVASARFTQAEATALLQVDTEFRAGGIAIQIVGPVQPSCSAADAGTRSADAGAAHGAAAARAAAAQQNAGGFERKYAPLATATNRMPAPAAARTGVQRSFVCRPVAVAAPSPAAPDMPSSGAESAAQASNAETNAVPANMQAQHFAPSLQPSAAQQQALQIPESAAAAAAAASAPSALPIAAAARKPFVPVRRSLGTASAASGSRTAAVAVSAAVQQSAVGVLTFGSPAAFAPGSLLLQVSLRAVHTFEEAYCCVKTLAVCSRNAQKHLECLAAQTAAAVAQCHARRMIAT